MITYAENGWSVCERSKLFNNSINKKIPIKSPPPMSLSLSFAVPIDNLRCCEKKRKQKQVNVKTKIYQPVHHFSQAMRKSRVPVILQLKMNKSLRLTDEE